MNFSVSRSYTCLSLALALTSVIALPGQCQQKKPKRVTHPPVMASRKNNASVMAFQAASSGDLVKLKGIISSGNSIRMQDKDGKTLLHHAVLGGRTAVVRWLVSQKIPLNTTDASNVSALAFARQNTSDADMEDRRAEIIRFLQEQGAQEIGKAPDIPTSDARETNKLKPVEGKTASLFKLLGKSRQEVERVLGTPIRSSNNYMDTWYNGPADSEIHVWWNPPAYGNREFMGEFWIQCLDPQKNWQDVLTMAGFKTDGVRLEKDLLIGVKGLPKGWHVILWHTRELLFSCKG